MKIRIGNDIRLLVRLLGKNMTDNITINSLKAYIINTTAESQALADLNNKTKFISRFPIEPMIDAYTATQYNINSTGYPSYQAFPRNHVIAPYAGFGVNPCWDKMYHPIPQHNLTEFLAPVKATDKRDTVEVLFPAEAQLLTGDYKIVVVAKLYEPGFSSNNLRTVTMDYENIFTLVNTSEEGVDTAVTLNVGSTDQVVTLDGDTDIVSGKTYTITINNTDGVKWYCKESNVKFLQEFKNSLIYTVTDIPSEDVGMNFQILALSLDENYVVGKIDIFVHNRPIALTCTSSVGSVTDTITLNYGESVKFTPMIEFENGEVRSYTCQNGNKVPAVTAACTFNSTTTSFNTTFVNGVFVAEVTNINNTSESETVSLVISTIAKNEEDEKISNTYYVYNNSASTFTGDIHAESGTFNRGSGTIGISLNDGSSFDVDMTSETLWYEGN